MSECRTHRQRCPCGERKEQNIPLLLSAKARICEDRLGTNATKKRIRGKEEKKREKGCVFRTDAFQRQRRQPPHVVVVIRQRQLLRKPASFAGFFLCCVPGSLSWQVTVSREKNHKQRSPKRRFFFSFLFSFNSAPMPSRLRSPLASPPRSQGQAARGCRQSCAYR